MSRATIYTELFALLSDMTTANGYSRDYTPVKSVDNDSATRQKTPFTSLHFGQEEPIFEGVGMNENRAMIPVEVTARVKVSHRYRNEIEYAEDIERSKVVSDIKKRFSLAHKEITGCVQIEMLGEEEAREDSNKNMMYVKYNFAIMYKEQK